ncbi:hypothetical protein OG320_05260 [Microbispora sp. NBC_01189]|uniref:hypothetical protein n=1 Tax=Microbispora sp. NBC_01189 TaxID=2903583 RepID=UPI002E11E802|nr:hypothetical protein OG320_05260 [Microbispora sp. NBC_01189]
MSGELPRVERDDDGRPVWVHLCAGTPPDFDPVARVTLPLGPQGWEWTADGGLTPSILCHNCGIHGFWMGGDAPHWSSC